MENCKEKLKECRVEMNHLEKSLEKAYAEENDILIKKYTEELKRLTSLFEEFKKCEE
jgi:uncharacterized membrane protein (DUF106 family)